MPQTGRSATVHPNPPAGVLGVELDESQYRLIRDLGDVVAQHLPLDPLLCRGMWLRAVRMHQAETRLPARHISSLPPEARLLAAKRIGDLFARLAAEHLGVSVDSVSIKRCVGEAEQMYRANYQER